ncbi:DUF559 domain-containing protein [Pseudonocardia sp. KRD-184]|uniref:DUF559 domain-containing protein n=1 Tax=Pseudonocardia oceani TaxID=2792013 RepID=A0ABS6UD97_9PSEU|nr:DUF559 domain-containing protein [Pseudonocardia oceani]MBW0088560.1 DUF559 domain-containing protein [Pseudonocardia oceani]MBW0095760.1 DUF559 domain-containing protein [Pseudonocardia oceani]MBW0108319.1 DUF559 domain-containing protein [Pseudonocardia oceani]MBW0120161.1 DUF559 domain-containing protein [Pseudonocardia oceani]MBW0130205.1 DUF559 domain-containing protein [Pseudonocardia oceani]
MPIPLLSPFRGSRAIAAGLVTPRILRGPRYRRLFPDVYVGSRVLLTLSVLARAAFVLVDGRGVVAGYAAAELLGASCARPSAPAEVLMLDGRPRRPVPGLVVHRDVLAPGETVRRGGVLMTDAVRTAFDLIRWAPDLVEKVTAFDAPAFHCGVTIEGVRALAGRHLGAHHTRGLDRVLDLVDGRAESPMESRIRVALVLGGLPAPVVQHAVEVDGRRYRLDLAYPDLLLAIEYDGREHRGQRRAHADLRREADLARQGWRILRFDALTVLQHPGFVVAEVRVELARRAARTVSP